MSGLGGGIADLTPRPNLSNLAFVPLGNTAWSPTEDPNSVVVYGPNGVITRDTGKISTVTLTPSGIVVKLTAALAEWFLSQGKLHAAHDAAIDGNVVIGGNAAVGGNASVAGSLGVTGPGGFGSTVDIAGNATAHGVLEVVGKLVLAGGATLRRILIGSAPFGPFTFPPGAATSFSIPVPGSATSDYAIVMCNIGLFRIMLQALAQGNSIGVILTNPTAVTIPLAVANYTAIVFGTTP
jgi:hypothetical protein